MFFFPHHVIREFRHTHLAHMINCVDQQHRFVYSLSVTLIQRAMIVLLDNTLHAYDDPVRLFFDYVRYISRQVTIFRVISTQTSSISEYLTNAKTTGDYLKGEVGPTNFREIWSGQRYGPAFNASIEKYKDIHSKKDDYVSIIPLVNQHDEFSKRWYILNEARSHFKLPHEIAIDPVKRLVKSLKSAIRHFSRNIDVPYPDPNWVLNYFIVTPNQEKKIKEMLKIMKGMGVPLPIVSIVDIIKEYQDVLLEMKCSKFLKDSVPVSDFARYCIVLRHHIFGADPRARKDLVLFWKLIWEEWNCTSDEERSRKMIGDVGLHRGWADDDEMGLFIESSEGSEEEISWNIDDSLECVLEDTIGESSTYTSDVSPRPIAKELVTHPNEGFTDSRFDVDITDTNRTLSLEDTQSLAGADATDITHDLHKEDQTIDLELKAACAKSSEPQIVLENQDYNEDKSHMSTSSVSENLDINKNELEMTLVSDHLNETPNEIKGADKETKDEIHVENLGTCELSLVSDTYTSRLSKISPTSPGYDADTNEELCDIDNVNIDQILEDGIEQYFPQSKIVPAKSFRSDSIFSAISTATDIDPDLFKEPGALTAMLDVSSSSAGSSALNSELDNDDIIIPLRSLEGKDETIPEKIDMFEKLSGHTRKHRQLNHGISYEDTVASEAETENVKRILKPAIKRADTSTVLELKEFIENKPELISLKTVTDFEDPRKAIAKKHSVKKGRSISEIFSALLDDNMRDLSVSAEYKNKIVRPQDLYNRIKIDSDKPWELLSRRTKEKYYGAFLRRYDDVINTPESGKLVLSDLLEIVKVCVDFNDYKHKVIQYAINIVDQDDLSSRQSSTDNDNSDIESLMSLKSRNSHRSIQSLANNQFISSMNMQRGSSNNSFNSMQGLFKTENS